MKIMRFFLIGALLLMLGVVTSASSPTAQEILQRVDGHRLISDDSEMTIRVERYLKNKLQDSAVMKGYILNGQMRSLVFLEPEKMKDRKITIKDKNDMWLIIPKVKNPIRITPSQRLIGGISYGDVAGVSYADDYTPKLNEEETVVGMNPDGTKTDPFKCFTLELTAKSTGVNYNKVVLWVDKQNGLPVKADFFALSGKKMSTVFYTAPKDFKGRSIITKMYLFDQINTKKYYSMEFYDLKAY
jgi:outer membrane lipoprotein-sorting protein